MRRKRFGDHRSSTDNREVTNGYAWKDDRPGADPDILANSHWLEDQRIVANVPHVGRMSFTYNRRTICDPRPITNVHPAGP